MAMNRKTEIFLSGLLCLLSLSSGYAQIDTNDTREAQLPLAGKRLAFLGDSITDGNTLPLLFEQSLKSAGIAPPICTNVAVAGNTAKAMLNRLERDVLPLHPDYVTVNAGVNDALGAVRLEQYSAQITAIVDKLSAAKIKVILITPTPITKPAGNDKNKAAGESYSSFLRDLAAQRGLLLASFDRRMTEAHDAGKKVMGEDGIHIDFEGYRIMTRELLNAMGYPNVPVPQKLEVSLMPGVIPQWKLRPAPEDKVLNDEEAARLKSDDTWKNLSLPQTPSGGWWGEQEQKRGFAMGVEAISGKSKLQQGIAEINSEKERIAYLNTGAGLQSTWLNGKKVFQASAEYSGWHAGKERIPVTVRQGSNKIIIECKGSFFLSLTDTNNW
ncbi:MAG: hypothetical protein A2X49_04280 [Lentisphaerae bacterium GWF2_52_8]|nr:MAG: hypothetical protein A2X49_04280 [Lentisphaerae bacterium GWF2_52_8]